MVQHYCHGVTMDGSQIFKGQWTGQVPVVYVLELLVTTNLMQKRGLRGHQRCKLFCQCILPTMQALVTHPILLISIQIITFIKWDPSCTSWRTRPAPRQVLTNQQWAFVGVATTSWDPTGAGISANPGCFYPTCGCCSLTLYSTVAAMICGDLAVSPRLPLFLLLMLFLRSSSSVLS